MNRQAEPAGPILFAYDGSQHAIAAIEQAGRLLRSGGRALILTVWQPLQTVPFFGGVATPSIATEVLEEGAKEAGEVAGEGTKLASDAGFRAEPLVEGGTPVWHRIVEVADSVDAAIVVLGSHGRSGLSYAAMGSVATSVAHHIDRPVLITRLPRDRQSNA